MQCLRDALALWVQHLHQHSLAVHAGGRYRRTLCTQRVADQRAASVATFSLTQCLLRLTTRVCACMRVVSCRVAYRKLGSVPVDEDLRRTIRGLCTGLAQALNRYYAFGSVFVDDAQ